MLFIRALDGESEMEKKAKVYQSGWLPRPVTFKPISHASLPLETMVSKLIDEDYCWNDRVI